ncbi:MAG TPA: aldo/keto reductase [Bryobacteraceae bacterium]|nr:aldo/keto reductase [Bryobacteraceae bacterium]
MIHTTDYITLGRSGLKVSPVCFGTMTFGNSRWGSDDTEARRIFARYIESGGNFLDTADSYADGKSEELTGALIKQAQMRDRVVLATKFTFNPDKGNPNSGGNGRKNIYRALEGSLRRLGTDYVDLYWLHVWDTVTPVEEVVATLSTLVQEGKIRYYGFSDVPAWYAARAVTLAQCRGWTGPTALQLEYSLVERNIEREHIPAARELGLGVCPWGPLASGFLAGKYKRDQSTSEPNSRLDLLNSGNNPVFHKFTEKNWEILDALQRGAAQLGRSPAQVALNWVMTQPGVTSTLIGARRMDQLEDNLKALEFDIPADVRAELDKASGLTLVHPYMFFDTVLQGRITGETKVRKWN